MELQARSKRGLWKKILMSVCTAVLLLTVSAPQTVHAATVQILSSKTGVLAQGEEKSFKFEVPVKAKVTVAFVGLSNGKGTYGDYLLKIIDSSENVVFEKEGRITYDDTNVSTTLSKGKYTVVLQGNRNWGQFKYNFSIKAAPTGKVATKTLKLNKSSVTLSKGKTYNLKAKFTPLYSTDKISWSSSNKKVATVDKSGKVTTKGLGKATITAKMGTKKAKCTVNVKSAYIEIDKGKTKSLLSMLKNISKYKTATWKSSNKSVATVGKDGKIKALKHGKTKIVAKISGKTYSITVYVYDHNVLVSKAKSKLKSILKNPNSLIINKTSGTGNYVNFDYSAMNGFGGYNREYFTAWFEKGALKYVAY